MDTVEDATTKMQSHGTDTLAMERPLGCLRSERTRNELTNSQQTAERRSVSFRAENCGQKSFRAVQLPKQHARHVK